MTSNGKGWREVKLKDVCREITVGHVGPMAKEYVDEGVPFLRSQNIQPFRLDLSSVKYVSPQFHSKLKKSALTPGDVAVVRTGYPGTACVIPETLPVSNCADLVVIRPSTELDSRYLAGLFNSTWGRGKIAGSLVGVAQQHFNVGAAKEMVIHLPPLPTQRKVASVLSAYDDLIENNTRRIEILEEMAQRIYREWFVDFRFPGHEKIGMVDSALGPIPEGWKVVPIAHFGRVITGKTPSKKVPEYYGEDMPFIKTPDMHNNMFCTHTGEYLSQLGVESQRTKTLPANSICVSCIGTVGIVSITSQPSQINQQINSLVLQNQSEREFLYFSLLGLKETIKRYGSTGATMANLSKGKFESLGVLGPMEEVTASFHRIVSPHFEQIKVLQSKQANLRRTRDLLLPKLISGEIDVEDLDIGLEVVGAG